MFARFLNSCTLALWMMGLGGTLLPAQTFVPSQGQETTAAEMPTASLDAFALDELETLAIQQNPQLTRAWYVVAAAAGRAEQAGLYPNPTIGVSFDELGDRTARSGINTLPLLSQEFVTGGKLRLSREAGLRQVDLENWRLMSQRYRLLADVRHKFCEALALQARIEILQQMVDMAELSVARSVELQRAGQVARLDVVQLEIEAERLKAELEATERELPGIYRDLAAVVGDPHLSVHKVEGVLSDSLSAYDLNTVQDLILTSHPDVYAARHGVERARLLMDRARREPIPNVSVDTGYVRQNQNRSDDFRIGASVSVPLWNRNQGNIRAAEAEYMEAQQQVRQVQNELTGQLALAMRDYSASRRRAERYSTVILPRAAETYDLSRKAYQGGEFEYLRVLEAQRALAQAHLEYIRSLGDGWKAAATLSGLTLEDTWPAPAVSVPPVPQSESPQK